MPILRNVPKTFTFEEQRVEVNEIAQDLYNLADVSVSLQDFSVTVGSPTGMGNLSYFITGTFPNEVGVFTYNPPDLSPYWQTDPTKISQWDTAYSWGNHALEGYLTGIGQFTLNALLDVTYIGTPSNGSILKYNGGWQLATDSGVALSDFSVNQLNVGVGGGSLTYDPSVGIFNFTPADIFSGNYQDLINKPNLATVATTGDYNDLVNIPTPSALPIVTDDNAPSNPIDGTLWWDSNEGKLKVYYDDGDTLQWVDAGPYTVHSSGGAVPTNLSDLANVEAGNPSDGHVLKWDATFNNNTGAWINAPDQTATAGSGISLTDLDASDNSGSLTTPSGTLSYNNSTGIFSFTGVDLSGYSTFDGDYNSLTNLPTLFSGSWNDLTDKPTLFSGSYNDLTDKPTIPTDIDDLGDVTASVRGSGDLLVFDSGQNKWVATGVNNVVSKGFKTLQVSGQSDIAAAIPEDTIEFIAGNNVTLATDAVNKTLTISSTGGGGGGASVSTNDTPPPNPADGDLWWDSTEGQLKIYYQDPDSYQWVDAVNRGSGAIQAGATAFTGLTDTPTGLTANKWLKVNATGTALEFTDYPTSVPVGAIIIWSGAANAIPTGWSICDGSNGTPDLRNKFVIGAGLNYSVNSQGGNKDAILVEHNHGGSGSSAGDHNHGGGTGNQDTSHTHGFSTGSSGNHNHNLNKQLWGYLTGDGGTKFVGDSTGLTGGNNVGTSNAGSHSHSGTTNSGGSNHNHSISGSGDHSHTITMDGSSPTDANLPPYYSLCYIMLTTAVGTLSTVPVNELKNVAAASSDFADFQARIAAL